MEFIPLKRHPSSQKRNDHATSRQSRKQHNTPQTTPKSSYMGCDSKLIPRIKQYLQTQKRSKGINISTMADVLQQKHSEYRRKKRNAFERSVNKAYNTISQEKLSNENGSSTKASSSDSSDFDGQNAEVDSDFSMDNDNYSIIEDTNAANNNLRNLYGKRGTETARKNKDNLTNPVTSTPSGVAISKDLSDSVLVPQNTATVEIPKVKIDGSSILGQKASFISDTPGKNSTTIDKKRKSATESDVAKKKGKASKEIVLQQSSLKFTDIGGSDKCIQEVCELLAHLKHPEVCVKFSLAPPRGLLLHGPPGCGKTLLAHAIAGELELPFIKIAATEIVSGVSGESEEKLRDLFEKAVSASPCVLFIDEIDAITPKRDTVHREMEKRIVTQLLVCFDDLSGKDITTQILVIGATNRPDALDPALRRPGRFDREIGLGIPDLNARIRILKVLCRKLPLPVDFNFSFMASHTPGYVGADLMALTREAALCASKRVFHSLQKSSLGVYEDEEMRAYTMKQEKMRDDLDPVPCYSYVLSWLRNTLPLTEEQLSSLFIEMSDFQHALKIVQPSALREGFATVPDVTWDDIGALHQVREELQLSIMAPIRHPEKFEALGLDSPAGILLCGPPGCGKTLLAKAIANESGINFISVKGPELLNMYLGESEKAVREVFRRAGNSAPCVIFFDELDALCPKRTESMEGNAGARVVNQLLTEMDGLIARRNVFILGASNRPDIIDPAVMRPGRLDKTLFIGLPSAEERVEILNTLTKHGTQPCLNSDVSLSDIGKDTRCNGFTGADLKALVREASMLALKESMAIDKVCPTCPIVVKKMHFEDAYHRVRLSVSPKELLKYEKMKSTYSVCGPAPSKPIVSMEIGETVNAEIMDTTEPAIS